MIQQGKKIYLCDLNLKPITILNGVKTDSANCNLRVKDYSELTFDVDEYIVIKGKKQKSLGYDMLLPYMTLYLEDIGMFQMQKPTEQNDGNGETKSIVAYSLEKEFEDRNWINFKCNTGEKDSLEQIAENNLNELGYAKEFVTFYNKNKHDLSFIHLLLEKMPGWSVDDDDIDSLLWDRKIPSITQDNINLYSLCCSTIAPRMNLLFLFDTIHRKIKAVAKENLNDKKYESTVFITYRNLAQSVEIQTDEDSIFTRFNVRGDNDLNVLNCNYGDYYIYNLDYFTCLPYMSNVLQEKVKAWVKYRDDNRESYIQIAKNRADANQKLNDIIYRNPSDDLNIKQWDDMSEDGLNESLKYYNSLITSLQVSVDPDWDSSNKDFSTYVPWKKSDGSVDHDKYLEKLKNLENGYGGYYTYYDILNYIIPNIEIAISNLNKTDDQKSEYVKDWETNWDLYGTIELDGLQKKYKTELETLEGYAKDWSDLTDDEKSNHSNNESNYNIYHKRYVEIYSYIGENGTLTTAIDDRNKEKENAEATVKNYQNQMDDLKTGASIDNKNFGFTEQEKITLYSLFHDEDYQNTNILSTSVDDSITEIDREKELFDDATDKLSEVAQPQYKFTVSMDNLYRLDEFQQWQGELQLLKFIRLGIRDDFAVKLRVVSISWNPCDVTDDLTVEFSNMITSRSGRSDLNELLDTDNNRGSQNSISFGTGNSDTEKEYLSSMLQQIIKMGAFKTAVGNIVSDTTTNLSEAQINTLISNYIQVAKIKVGNIEGDKAEFNEIFTKYLDSDLISTKLIQGENGDFIDFVNSHLDFKTISTELLTGGNKDTFIDFINNQIQTSTIIVDQIQSKDGKTFVDLVNGQIQSATISADKITGLSNSNTFIDFVNNQIKTNVVSTDLANIKNLLAGSAGVGDLQTIHLTTSNAVIDEAVIKNLIASKISVADLVAHAASAELITLISQDGKPSIAFKNSTQQFYDSKGNVRVQIGQDATGNFTFSLYDETGTGVLIDSKEGVHPGAIGDGLIVNDMLKDSTISKGKLNFPIVETDENGKVSITEILDGSGNEFGISYKEFQDNTNNAISGVEQKVDKANKSITDKIWTSDITNKINDYDQSTVKDIKDQISTVEQNLSGISSTVKEMETTISDKADGSTVTELTKRIAKAEQDASGFKQTVEETYAKNDDITSMNSAFEQLSNKFEWMVTSNSSQSSLILTDSLISAITQQFVIKDNNGAATIIEGGKIKADSITSDMLSSSAIKSTNYKEGTDKTFSSIGSFLDLDTGALHMPNIYTDDKGNAYFKGSIVATSLSLGEDVLINCSNVSGLTKIATSEKIGTVQEGSVGIEISQEGLLKASNAVIYGTIYATDGKFSGEVIASSGQIADCTIEKGKFVVPFANISGTLQVNQIAANSISADKLTSDNIVGTNGWINLANGTFNYGNGKFVWDGETASIEGKIKSVTGTIGCWTLDDYSIYRTNKAFAASDGMYFGTSGLSISDKFKVSSDGILTAVEGNISGDINATNMTAKGSYSIYYNTTNGIPTDSDKIITAINWEDYNDKSVLFGFADDDHVEVTGMSVTKSNRSIVFGGESIQLNGIVYVTGTNGSIPYQNITWNPPSSTVFSCNGYGHHHTILPTGTGTNAIGISNTSDDPDVSAEWSIVPYILNTPIDDTGRYTGENISISKDASAAMNIGSAKYNFKCVYTKSLNLNGKSYSIIDSIYNAQGYGIRANYNSTAKEHRILPSHDDENADGLVTLGSNGTSFKSIWCTQNSINSKSDINMKEDIKEYNETIEQAYMEFQPVSYRFKNFSKATNHDRTHYGLIAQGVEETLHKYGITNEEAGFLLIDQLEEPNEAGSMVNYGLRYGEFISINMHMIQKAHHRIDNLEKSLTIALCTIKSLQEEVSTLKQTIA